MVAQRDTQAVQGKLLIVCPHFAPVNGADGQRVRIYLAGLIAAGWDPHILACRPDDLPMSRDPLLCAGLPASLTIHRVPCRPSFAGRLAGATTTGRNAYRFVRQCGDRLLASGDYRGVLFSTTAFRLLPLGLRWRRRYAVPFVIDLQDPWFQTHYSDHPDERPPGGRLRFALANAHARRWEPPVLAAASGIVAVSPAYETTLRARYPALSTMPFLTLPFGAAKADFALLDSSQVQQNEYVGDDGLTHLVHVGRGGKDLWPALQPLFAAVQSALASGQDWARSLRMHFIGTSYAPEGRQEPSIAPLAQSLGIADVVDEQPGRIGYFPALRCLADSAGIILPLSSDAGYNASKIHNCVMAGRPILALASRDTVAAAQLAALAPQITVVNPQSATVAAQCQSWLRAVRDTETQPVPAAYPFEADRLAGQLATFLASHFRT